MTIVWWILVALCLVFGFLGCFINKVPGPIAVVIAMLIAMLALEIPISWGTFAIVAALAVVSIIASKVLVKLVKKLHEYSKRATWGTTIGSIIGLCLFLTPGISDSTGLIILIFFCGLVLIPFVLAFLLELTNKNGAVVALKAAGTATLAYFVDTMLKLVVFGYAIYTIFNLG
ncbi:MAG: DUF456 domain-containing protein [Paludibacteraceae bacterium]|nr:DUF456 domain-containing protein [Paludibacteraceae bacterium]